MISIWFQNRNSIRSFFTVFITQSKTIRASDRELAVKNRQPDTSSITHFFSPRLCNQQKEEVIINLITEMNKNELYIKSKHSNPDLFCIFGISISQISSINPNVDTNSILSTDLICSFQYFSLIITNPVEVAHPNVRVHHSILLDLQTLTAISPSVFHRRAQV